MSTKRSRRKRNKKKNRHHLTPVSCGGDNDPSNFLLLNVGRHRALHNAFRKKNGKERTLEDIIILLVRVHRMKGRCVYAKMGLPCRLAVCLDVRAEIGNGVGQVHRNNGQPRKGAGTQRRNAQDKRVPRTVQSRS